MTFSNHAGTLTARIAVSHHHHLHYAVFPGDRYWKDALGSLHQEAKDSGPEVGGGGARLNMSWYSVFYDQKRFT